MLNIYYDQGNSIFSKIGIIMFVMATEIFKPKYVFTKIGNTLCLIKAGFSV